MARYELLIDTPANKKGGIVDAPGGHITTKWKSGDVWRDAYFHAPDWPAIFKPVKELKEIRFVKAEDHPDGGCTTEGQYIMRHFSTHSDSIPFRAGGGTLNTPFTIYRREDIYE